MITPSRPPKSILQLAVFGLISLPPVFLYLAASSGAMGWTWVLLALVVAGNLLAIAIY